MPWPTPQDYNEAVQNPRTCFSDPELRGGSPALTPLGLPKPITGAFASVYRVDCPGRRWAVRCFLREYADQRRRYSAISDRLRAAHLPCMVGFEFLPEGIRVAGRWYPILKMEWIDGEALNDYIARNLKRADILRALSRRWIDLVASLGKTQIAHGDLQHGNILVSGGELKLIDYDAMYVPALNGLESHEEGHRNYQHPARTGKDYDAGIDNFSAWVIFTSISALAIEPSLWDLPNVGDECLLFRREDFEKPWTSKTFRALESKGNDHLRTLVSHFRSILGTPLGQVPSLDGSILNASAKPSSTQHAHSKTQGLPNWLDDHIPRGPGESELEPIAAEGAEPRSDGADWLYDHLLTGGSIVARKPVAIPRRDRIAAWSCLGLPCVMLIFWSVGWISGLVFALVVAAILAASGTVLSRGYKANNITAKRESTEGLLKAARTAVSQIENAINLSKLERSRLGEPLSAIKASFDRLPRSKDAKIDGVSRELARVLEDIDERRQQAQNDYDTAIERLNDYEAAIELLDDGAGKPQLDLAMTWTLKGIERRRHDASMAEKTSLSRHERRFASALDELVQRRAALVSDERAEADRLLRKSRELHFRLALCKATLTASTVSGVGEALLQRLQAAGIACASDVAHDRVRKVPGIGDAKARALVDWRRLVEQQADLSAPSSLSPAEIDRIRDQYASKRASIDQQIISTNDEEKRERKRLDQEHSSISRRLDEEERMIRQEFDEKQKTRFALNKEKRDELVAKLSATQQDLSAQEQRARRDRARKQQDVEWNFNRERARLAAEYKAEGVRIAEARKKVDDKLAQLNRALFERRRDVHRLARELESLQNIRVKQYLGLILLPARKP